MCVKHVDTSTATLLLSAQGRIIEHAMDRLSTNMRLGDFLLSVCFVTSTAT